MYGLLLWPLWLEEDEGAEMLVVAVQAASFPRILFPVDCVPGDEGPMNPVALAVDRVRVGVSLDNDGDIGGGRYIPSDIECDGCFNSVADVLAGGGDSFGFVKTVCEVILRDIDRRFFTLIDGVGEACCTSTVGVVLSWVTAVLLPSAIVLSESSSSGIPKSASVTSALKRLLMGTIV